MRRRKPRDILDLFPRPVVKCNCENEACKHPHGCKHPAGDSRIMYLGRVCDRCAKTYPAKYHL